MKKIKEFFNEYGLLILSVLSLFLMVQTCNLNSNLKSVKKEVRTYKVADSVQVASLKNDIKIQGLEASKRTLYDWNAVVRTAVRPDDRMNQYDEEIKKLEKQ